MIPDPGLLPPPVAAALERATVALDGAGVPCAVGGSALVRMLGGEVAVNDVDLLVAAADREAVVTALEPWSPTVSAGGPDPWHSAWRLGCRFHPGAVPLDVVGGMRLRIGATMVPVEGTAATVRVGATEVLVSDPAVWVLVYRVVDPARAALLERLVGDDAVLRAAERMGLDLP
jgi:hypothetical protein